MQSIPVRSPYQVQKDVLYALLLREFSARFGRSRVGFFWVLIEPITHVAFPVLMFGFILDRHVTGYDYPVFLMYGLLPYFLFRSICMQTMDGVNTSRGLLSYRPVHLIDVIFTKAIFTFCLESMLFLIIATALTVFFDYQLVPARPVEWLCLMLGIVLFALGLGMILAAMTSFAPDIKSVIRIIFLPLYLISGVVLPISRFPSRWLDVLAWNPLLHWIEGSRHLGLPHYQPIAQQSYAVVFFSSAVTLFFGLSLYRLRRLSRVTT
ncbi:ABC transporter permease [Ideonella sp. DXS29W]|uniref:Transport permease protein n=1 Tax=Ideonella lacteola TaxID=2984193 RepID=A0ABU9BPH7_9BURK